MTRARLWFPICGLGLLAAGRAPALDLPVRYPDREPLTAPAFRGDALEITLAPAAARQARRALPAGPGESARRPAGTLGVPALDRVAATLGGTRFEREFPGESPPPEGGDEPDFTAFFRVHLPPGVVLEDALARFRALPEVAAADPIAVLPVAAVPNDSLWSASWWYFQPTRADIHAPEAWDYTAGDTAIVVAIIDTGVLPYHPDLGGVEAGLPGQMWTNWTERGGLPFWDDDGNGYEDDVSGWDFVSLTTGSGVAAGEDWSDADADPSDFAGHGTLVAGLAGALTDNATGVVGTAWRVRLMPLRIGWSATCPGCALGLVDMSYAAAAIRYATRMGASVINCSFATLNTGGLGSAAAAAVRAGVTIVCSAGNSEQAHELQNRDDVIAVASSDVGDGISSFSNTGAYVDLAAPGEDVTSTFVAHAGEDSIAARQPAYTTLSGTSLSSPLVAGAAALVQARQRALGERPLAPQSMVMRLRETADDISALNPFETGYGTGRLNMERALADPPTSYARRVGASVSGPAVVLPVLSGRTRIALATGDWKLLLLDARNADTIATAALPSGPARQIAAADLGGGYGVGLFVGTQNGKVAGFDPRLGALPGWPVSGAGVFYSMNAGPALGDLDGDGVLEIVCGSSDGNVWAWHPDGTPVEGFPVSSGITTLSGPVALGDLDGKPGAEIVAANFDGSLHVFRWDGSEPAGWPVTAGATSAPIVLRLGHAAEPSIVVCAEGTVKAIAPDGTTRWSATAGGTVFQDPAAGDLDGDGADEIVVPLASPNAIGVLDSIGGARLNLGWPRALDAAPAGPPLVGRLAAGPRPGVYVFAGGTQVALSDSARALPQFPKPGRAGMTPTLAELDGDGRTEMIAGTSSDSVLYVYDAGADTWGSGEQSWGTPRANFARTGNRLYAPPIGILDDIAPAAVTSLAADSISADGLVLHWTAPGDDGGSGRAMRYQLQMTTRPGAAGDFSAGASFDAPAPDTAGSAQRFVVRGLAPNTRYFFALRARDEAGNWGPTSNLVRIMTPLGRARSPRVEGGPAIAARARPGTLAVALEWRAAEGTGDPARRIEIYDVGGRRLRRIALGAGEEGVVRWDGRDASGRRLPAGLYFARLTSGSLRAQARVVLIP